MYERIGFVKLGASYKHPALNNLEHHLIIRAPGHFPVGQRHQLAGLGFDFRGHGASSPDRNLIRVARPLALIRVKLWFRPFSKRILENRSANAFRRHLQVLRAADTIARDPFPPQPCRRARCKQKTSLPKAGPSPLSRLPPLCYLFPLPFRSLPSHGRKSTSPPRIYAKPGAKRSSSMDFLRHRPRPKGRLARHQRLGKSTLLRILAGRESDFAGTVTRRTNLAYRYLDQAACISPAEAKPENGRSRRRPPGCRGNLRSPRSLGPLARYFLELPGGDAETLADLAAIDREHGWDLYGQVQALAGQLDVDLAWNVNPQLSGGQIKKIQLIRALAGTPDLLFLDEPTNHLDESAIRWLEGKLASYPGTLVVVTHDRYFLENAVDHILELWQGQMRSFPGNYGRYLEKKAEREESLAKADSKRLGFLRTEIDWIRRGAWASAGPRPRPASNASKPPGTRKASPPTKPCRSTRAIRAAGEDHSRGAGPIQILRRQDPLPGFEPELASRGSRGDPRAQRLR